MSEPSKEAVELAKRLGYPAINERLENGSFVRVTDIIQSALDAARDDGAREMREEVRKLIMLIHEDNKKYGALPEAVYYANQIITLPLPSEGVK